MSKHAEVQVITD